MSLDSLKLTNGFNQSFNEAGIHSPTEFQNKTVGRIIGGQSLIGIGPEGCGKTTAMVMGVLMKLKFPYEEAPRALILVSDKERGLKLVEMFEVLGHRSGLRIIGLFTGAGLEGQKEALAEGTDIVIGTPDRIEFVYAKSGLNLNKLKIFVLDDAELIVKQGFNAVIINLSESLPKCQHLILTEVMHNKLEKLTDRFLNHAEVIEVSGQPDIIVDTIQKVLFKVPNYKTKLNLLNLMLRDSRKLCCKFYSN